MALISGAVAVWRTHPGDVIRCFRSSPDVVSLQNPKTCRCCLRKPQKRVRISEWAVARVLRLLACMMAPYVCRCGRLKGQRGVRAKGGQREG